MMSAPFFDQATSMDFKVHFSKAMEKYGIVAAGYALIDHGDIIELDVLSKNSDVKATADFLFQACSFSKSLTAFAALKLIQAGQFNLDDPLTTVLKKWGPAGGSADKARVTVRRCLNMTSGLAYANPAVTYLQAESIPVLSDILHGVEPAKTGVISVATSPGTRYSYSGAGYS